MGNGTVAVEQQGEIAVLRLQHPPANAIDLEIAAAVETALHELRAKPPGALVITGSGKFFSGGLDLKVIPTYTPDQQRAFLQTANRMIAALYALPFPVVAAVNGHAVAAGFVIPLAADYRVGPEEGAVFGLTEARVGIPFPAGPLIVMRAELPPQTLRYTTLYAKNFSPQEAFARGVLDELAAPDHVFDRAMEVAQDMATMPADGYQRIKHQVRGPAIAELEQLIASGTDPLVRAWLSKDAESASANTLKKL